MSQPSSKNQFLILIIAFILLLNGASTTPAALIGNDPGEFGGWNAGMDGHQALSVQIQNAITQSGFLDSFTFYTGVVPSGFGSTSDFVFAVLVLRPTGNAFEYTIIFDSGNLNANSYADNQVHTVNITPVAVQPDDVIASWGRGIAFDLGTTGEDTWFYNGSLGSTPKPSGTFLAPGPSYTLAGTGDREYALAFNFVPEPASIALLFAGSLGWMMIRRRHRHLA